MKVFLSWSGSRSHKVALVFREWLPSVIQEIVPYVSSEDIDKGARWSTDISQELSDSKFGILCVTRENISAPWLTFEAGALSKTMDKAFVSPFLFDVKRSEVDGPILQFQSTIFEQDDLLKLVTTLNKACDKDGLAPERLNKAFTVWYPTLEKELENLRDKVPAEGNSEEDSELQTRDAREILEEVLENSRINQKLIRNQDGALGSSTKEITDILQNLLERTRRLNERRNSQVAHGLYPMLLEEIARSYEFDRHPHLGLQMILALFKNQYPWLYDAGMETIRVLRSRRSTAEKHSAVEHFMHVVRFAIGHPMMQEAYGFNEDLEHVAHKLHDMLLGALHRNN